MGPKGYLPCGAVLVEPENLEPPPTTMIGWMNSIVIAEEETFGSGNRIQAWRFHTNHGDKIHLNDDRQVARHTGGLFDLHGVVVSERPMSHSVLYEVRLDQVDEDLGWCLPWGAVLADPDHLRLPRTTFSGWESAAVWSDFAYLRGKQVRTSIKENTTWSLNPDSRVGVVLDSTSCLHLLVDGRDQGVIAADLSTPCFPFFQLGGRYIQITALPPRPMVWQ